MDEFNNYYGKKSDAYPKTKIKCCRTWNFLAISTVDSEQK